MKSSIFKNLLFSLFVGFFFFVNSNEAMAQTTYATVISGITHKIHLEEERGKPIFQSYDSKTNKWRYNEIVASDSETNYLKIRDKEGKEWEVIFYEDNTCILKDDSGYTVKYWME